MSKKIPKKTMKRLLKETPKEFWDSVPAAKDVMFRLYDLVGRAYAEGYEDGCADGHVQEKIDSLSHPAGFKDY